MPERNIQPDQSKPPIYEGEVRRYIQDLPLTDKQKQVLDSDWQSWEERVRDIYIVERQDFNEQQAEVLKEKLKSDLQNILEGN